MARYLVTGGAGFIGSALARRLIKDGHEVVILDNLSTGLRRNLPPEAVFVESDVSRPEFLKLLPGGTYAGVAHLAAQSSGAIGQKNPYLDMQTNVGSTMLLSRWCIETCTWRLLYASSMTAYGKGSNQLQHEGCTSEPISYYGVSKLASEHYLRVASIEGLKPTMLRLFNVYGPGQNLGNIYQGMASIYLAYLLQGVTVPVTGSFDRFRDFCYIDDVVEAFRICLGLPETPSPVYNIGTGRMTTVRELLRLLIAAMGLPPDHPVEELAGSPNDTFGSVADISLAARELGWRPRVPIEDGIRRMVDWAKTQ